MAKNVSIEDFIKKVEDKVESLRSRSASCWVCEETTNSWGVIIPEDQEDGLGFGSKGDGSSRIIFFPVCQSHNMDDPQVTALVKFKCYMKRMTMTN